MKIKTGACCMKMIGSLHLRCLALVRLHTAEDAAKPQSADLLLVRGLEL